MKILREKSIRKQYLADKLDILANLVTRGVTRIDKLEYPDTNSDTKPSHSRQSYRNICIETGRTRGVISRFKISRLVFRSYADRGKLEGIKRASW